MSSATKFSRRSLVKSAGAAVALDAAARLFLGSFASRSATLSRLQRAAYDGDGRSLAADAFVVAEHPIFILTVQAKWDSNGFLNRPNPAANGIVNNPLAAASTVLPQYNLTKMFGDYLAPIANTVAFGIVPVTTTSGNHVYDGLRSTMASVGCLPAFAANAMGSLLPLHFSSVGTADASTACFDQGGNQLISYTSVGSAVTSMLNALKPLGTMPAQATTLLTSLNNRITTDQSFRLGLEQLAQRLQAAQTPLNAAAAVATANPQQLNAASQMTDAVLASNNPLLPQFATASALIDLGLVHAVTMSIANSDPNAGGDHNGRGGSNVAFGVRSPNEVKSCVAQALARIYAKYPKALVSITSDGGRSADGGDQENFEAFICGPQDLIASTFVNAASRADSSLFGMSPQPVKLSDGSMQVPSQAHLMSTVATAAGLTLGTIPHIVDLLAT